MKKFLSTICLGLLFCMQASAQTADKPDLMIVPADNWFFTNGFYKEVNINGQVRKAPDYERAFTENQEKADGSTLQ